MNDPYPVIRFLAYLTLFGQGIAVLTIFFLIIFWKKSVKILDIIGRKSLILAFTVALTATMGSLFFSEIAEYEPCKLCWFQRIAMYPQVVLFAVALWIKEEAAIVRSSVILCLIGASVSIFHYMLQMIHNPTITNLAPCSLYGGSCTEYYILQFGYITIPFMALIAFALILLLMLVRKRGEVLVLESVDF